MVVKHQLTLHHIVQQALCVW